MNGRPHAEPTAELEAFGVVIVVDDDLRVAHVSERCDDLLGRPAAEVIGQPLSHVAGPDADWMLRGAVAEGLERAGGWWPAELPGGRRVRLRAFGVAPQLVGLDLVPVIAADADAADADSIERVAAWNDWLISCTSSASLLEAAASITRERLGFDGAWVCRIEGEGHSVVVASDVEDETTRLIGHTVQAAHMPPSQPRLLGRPIPFFVADLASEGVRLVPDATRLDLDGSALLRPYPAYLQRLAGFGVHATANLPIVVDGRLWGRVIATHSSALRVSAATQSELRLLAAATSARLAELIEQEDALEQIELARFSLRVMGSVAAHDDLFDGLAQDGANLSGVCAADGAIVSIGGRIAALGLDVDPEEVAALLATARRSLRVDQGVPYAASVSLARGLGIAPETAAGFLAVRLGRDVEDIVVWVRGENDRAETWIGREVAGDAIADDLFAGVAQLGERSNGTCAPWTSAQIAQVDGLRDAIGQVLIARYRQVQALNIELVRSNEEYDAFAYAAAHDLKAPLRGIRQNVSFHLEDTEGRLSRDEVAQLHTITRLADRMGGLLDDLMAYAQVGNAGWHPRRISIEHAVAEVVDLLGPALDRCTVDVRPGTLEADPAALRQILLNLIGNATKYAGDRPAHVVAQITALDALTSAGDVAVPSRLDDAPGDLPVLTIADQGIGIDPAHHERVFKLFHQLDPVSDGTGTGLALCRLICRRQGGDIWLRSEEGRGATFFVVAGL